MSKTYYNRTVVVTARPRSRRLREAGGYTLASSGSGRQSVSPGYSAAITQGQIVEALGYTPANPADGYLTAITGSMVTEALGYTPASGSAESLQRPRLRIVWGYEDPRDPQLMTPRLIVRHPLLNANIGAEAVLMLWRKRRTKSLSEDPVGKKIKPQHHSAWGEARGASATSPALTFSGMVALDTLRLHILHNYMCVYGQALPSSMTLAQFYALTSVDYPRFGRVASWTQSQDWFKSITKGRELFGIAIRYPNPAFTAEVDDSRTLAETTREINGVPRYIYTDVAPLVVQITASGDTGKSYEIGFDVSGRLK